MPNYIRAKDPGGTFFITIVTHARRPILTQPHVTDLLQKTYRETAQRYRFRLHAFCVLPDHLHALITLPRFDPNFSKRCQFFKSSFTRAYSGPSDRNDPTYVSRYRKGEARVWQRRFWEHTIRGDEDFERHFDYIHFNPVKHGLVDQPGAWSWSSFRRYAERGYYDTDWGEEEPRTIRGLADVGE